MNILTIKNLSKAYSIKTGFAQKTDFYAVQNVNFHVKQGTCLGIVGESGCGKSTLAKMIVGLLQQNSGEILYKEQHIASFHFNPTAMQMIFQDPFSSLNPRKSIGKSIAEPLLLTKKYTRKEVKEKTLAIMQEVGLSQDHYYRYPHEFSGGQRQRIAIARAIITKPELLICDEPVSALDASHQSQVLNLLLDLKEKYQLSYVFISHNLQVVSFMCDEIAVMYAGEIIEQAEKTELFQNPKHPYTKALIASAPSIGKTKDVIPLQGEPPKLSFINNACSFASRCPFVMKICTQQKPQKKQDTLHLVSCHLYT